MWNYENSCSDVRYSQMPSFVWGRTRNLNVLIFVTALRPWFIWNTVGSKQLQDAAWNYWNNWLKVFGNHEDKQMSYEKALQNLIVFMFQHYIDSFECHGARNLAGTTDGTSRLTYRSLGLDGPDDPQDNSHSSWTQHWPQWGVLSSHHTVAQNCSARTLITCTIRVGTLGT